jgi:hypothetical protein
MEVVRDTVEVSMPYIESRNRACNPPRPAERESFRKRLESILRPFFKVMGDEPQVDLWEPDAAFLQSSAPFGLLLIAKRGATIPAPDGLFRDVLLKLAEDTSSTRIIQQVDGGLVVALLNQYRYWTPSRARLLGAELVREHLDASFGPESCPHTQASVFAEQVAISKHPRTFSYVENALPAGTIVIRHLWLRRGCP